MGLAHSGPQHQLLALSLAFSLSLPSQHLTLLWVSAVLHKSLFAQVGFPVESEASAW